MRDFISGGTRFLARYANRCGDFVLVMVPRDPGSWGNVAGTANSEFSNPRAPDGSPHLIEAEGARGFQGAKLLG